MAVGSGVWVGVCMGVGVSVSIDGSGVGGTGVEAGGAVVAVGAYVGTAVGVFTSASTVLAMREVDSSVARENHTRSLPLSTIMTSESASDDGMFQHTEPSIVPLVNSSVPDCRLSGINPHEGKYVVGLNVLKTTLLSPTALRSAMNVLDPGPRYLTLTVAM